MMAHHVQRLGRVASRNGVSSEIRIGALGNDLARCTSLPQAVPMATSHVPIPLLLRRVPAPLRVGDPEGGLNGRHPTTEDFGRTAHCGRVHDNKSNNDDLKGGFREPILVDDPLGCSAGLVRGVRPDWRLRTGETFAQPVARVDADPSAQSGRHTQYRYTGDGSV